MQIALVNILGRGAVSVDIPLFNDLSSSHCD